MSDGQVVPFGKYKGRDILEVLEADPGYLQWLAGQDWFRAKYISLHQTIINRGAEPEETPEHNALQVKFLDDDFCLRFLRCVDPKYRDSALAVLRSAHQHGVKLIANAIISEQARLEKAKAEVVSEEARIAHTSPQNVADRRYGIKLAEKARNLHSARIVYLFRFREKFAAPVEELEIKIHRNFEECGVDVILTVSVTSAQHDIEPNAPPDLNLSWAERDARGGYYAGWIDLFHPLGSFHIELKPTIGDDYPAVLRQMKANKSKYLFVGQYVGQGATREQFIKTFEIAGFRVVFLEECA
jgi:exodeoxyribonuclease X-like protein